MKLNKYMAFMMFLVTMTTSCQNDFYDTNQGIEQHSTQQYADADVSISLPLDMPGKKTQEATRAQSYPLTSQENTTFIPQIDFSQIKSFPMTVQICLVAEKDGNKAHALFTANTSDALRYVKELGRYSFVLNDKIQELQDDELTLFKQYYEANPASLHGYLSIVMGGNAKDNANGRSFDPNGPIDVPGNDKMKQSVRTFNKKEVILTPDAEFKVEETEVNDRLYTSNLSETGVNIPMATKGWLPMSNVKFVPGKNGKDRLVIGNSKDNTPIVIETLGNIVGYTYATNKQLKNQVVNAIQITGNNVWMGSVDVSFPTDLASIESGSKPAVTEVGNNRTMFRLYDVPSGVIPGSQVATQASQLWLSAPVYLWSFSKENNDNQVKMTFKIQTMDMDPENEITELKNTEPSVTTYYQPGEPFVDYTKTVAREPGTAYLTIMNTENFQLMPYGDLIITELYHNNPSRALGDNLSMVEIYNPTDRAIDLTQYGLVRTTNYGKYFVGSGSTTSDGEFDTDQFELAKVQTICSQKGKFSLKKTSGSTVNGIGVGAAFGDRVNNSEKQPYKSSVYEFKTPIYRVNGTVMGKEKDNLFRILSEDHDMQKIDPAEHNMLAPGQCIVVAAGHWIEYNFKGFEDLDEEVRKSLNKAEGDKHKPMKYIIAVDNGQWVNSQGNDKYGHAAGVLQMIGKQGLILVKQKTNDIKDGFEPIDAVGPSAFGIMKNIKSEKQPATWIKYFSHFTGVSEISKEDTKYCWIRNDNPSHSLKYNMPSLSFLRGIGGGKYNTELGDDKLFDPQYAIWCLNVFEPAPQNKEIISHYPFIGKKKSSMGYRNASESN